MHTCTLDACAPQTPVQVVDDSNHGGAFIVSKGAGATPAATRPAAGDEWEIRASASSRV